MLIIKNLSKAYNGKYILHNINLSVKSGEIALLIGPSGVGKSTLLRLLNNLETIDEGYIELDNKVIFHKVKDKHIVEYSNNQMIGMVFQNFNLFENMTVKENITFALKRVKHLKDNEANLIANELLEKYKLEDYSNECVLNLSGGQKQRLAIARTLALKPRVICLDEPTSALDPLLTNYLISSINEFIDNNYILVISSHDINLINRLNSHIYFLDNGSILENCSLSDLKNNISQCPNILRFINHQY